MNKLFAILLGASLVGCASVAHKQPILISEDSKPDWVENYKLEDSTHLFFTGVSTKYAEERKALKDAKYDALSKFLDYNLNFSAYWPYKDSIFYYNYIKFNSPIDYKDAEIWGHYNSDTILIKKKYLNNFTISFLRQFLHCSNTFQNFLHSCC